MNTTKAQLIKQIEAHWVTRATNMVAEGIKPSTMKYKDAEVSFFVGAMSAFNSIFPNEDPTKFSEMVPMHWIINPQIGRLIVERYRIDRTSRIAMIERANVLMFNSHGNHPPSSEVLKMADDYITGKDGGQFLSYIQGLPDGE